MDAKENIPISRFGSHQSNILFKRLVFQNLCPGKFFIEDPWPFAELDEDEVEALKDELKKLMPLDTIVTDMWDWDIRFEDTTFEDIFFEVALGPEENVSEYAKDLKEDFLQWIDEYNINYAEDQFSNEEFNQWVHDQCEEFIQKWRSNIVKKFA